jgi:hypothetical protein
MDSASLKRAWHRFLGRAPRWIVGAVRIYVVGCNHGIQLPPDGLWSRTDKTEMQEQRRHFTALLEDILKRMEIGFIGEEGGGGEETIAEILGKNHKIPISNINTSNADKKRLGIPCDYVSGSYSATQKELWHRLREQFMLARIGEYGSAAKNLLVVCGFVHLERLSELLWEKGVVKQIDYREAKWYRPEVFAGDD